MHVQDHKTSSSSSSSSYADGPLFFFRPARARARARLASSRRRWCRRWRCCRGTTHLLATMVVVALCLYLTVRSSARSHANAPPHYHALRQRCVEADFAPGCANPNNEKIFISSVLYDQGGALAGGRWGERVLELVSLLGPQNVYLSVYESESDEAATSALMDWLRPQLRCHHDIIHEPPVAPDAFPTVALPNGRRRVKRASVMAEMRNRALRPLDAYQTGRGLVWFDRVLFLDAIAFHPLDAAHLLFNTNRGSDGRAHYLAACAMDFDEPTRFHDLSALRDADGYAATATFPFFRNRGRGLSRGDMLRHKDAVRVRSCWSGLVAMEAKYIQNRNVKLPRADFHKIGSHVVDPASPRNITAPVRFRHEPEPYYDACERCLFAADVALVARQDGAWDADMVVNPFVRVAQQDAVLDALSAAPKRDGLLRTLLRAVRSWFEPGPAAHPYRAVAPGQPFAEEVWAQDRWQLVERRGRSGLFCGVRGMQLLRADARDDASRFVHARIPPGQKLHVPRGGGKPLPTGWEEVVRSLPPDVADVYFEDEEGLPAAP